MFRGCLHTHGLIAFHVEKYDWMYDWLCFFKFDVICLALSCWVVCSYPPSRSYVSKTKMYVCQLKFANDYYTICFFPVLLCVLFVLVFSWPNIGPNIKECCDEKFYDGFCFTISMQSRLFFMNRHFLRLLGKPPLPYFP